MSATQIKQIDGDVAVSRNAMIGGDVTARGSATVDHDLTVKGWLEAPNIKAANKGFYATEEDLFEAYPSPRSGWWALVGSELPAEIYIAKKGQWIDTGKKGGEHISLDFHKYDEIIEYLSGKVIVKGEYIGLRDWGGGAITLALTDESIIGIPIPIATAEKCGLFPAAFYDRVNNLPNDLITLSGHTTAIRQLVDSLSTLAKTGACTPYFSGEVVELEDKDINSASASTTGNSLGAQVVYDKKGARFVLRFGGAYWANWIGAADNYSSDGAYWVPKAGVLYRAIQEPYGLWYFDSTGAHLMQGTENIDYVSSDKHRKDIEALTSAIAALKPAGINSSYFSGICEAVPENKVQTASYAGLSTDEGCTVVYDTAGARFLLYRIVPQQGAIPRHEYYTNWGTDTEPSEPETMGFIRDGVHWVPKPGVLYRATESPYGLWYFDEQGGHRVITPAEALIMSDGRNGEVAISDAAKKVFIDMWVAAGGQYNRETNFFGLNGINDIDYTEAMKIWRMSFHQHRKSWVNAYGYNVNYGQEMAARYFCRTYFPLVSLSYQPGNNMQAVFDGNSKVEVAVIYGGYSSGSGHYNLSNTFRNCRALRRVVLAGPWDSNGASALICDSTTFQGCVNLERIDGAYFWGGGQTLDLSMARKFEIDSIEKFVDTNSIRDSTCTIILHADTYAKVTDELLEAAAAKNITISTP